MLSRTYLIFLVFVSVLLIVDGRYPWFKKKPCKDNRKDCHVRSLKDYQFCAVYGPSVCKKYCGYCKPTCKDTFGREYYCRIYARTGKCNRDYANRYCRKTCRKCS